MNRLTEAQKRALRELSGVELGYVHPSTAMALRKAELIERHPTSRITDWWSLTAAGRTALEGRKDD